MNNDRELLGLAAKAAGRKVFSYIDDPIFGCGINDGDTDSKLWNPLTDDGDRYRLLAKLKGKIDFNKQFVAIGDVVMFWPESEPNEARAVVRAAAEIGKSIP